MSPMIYNLTPAGISKSLDIFNYSHPVSTAGFSEPVAADPSII